MCGGGTSNSGNNEGHGQVGAEGLDRDRYGSGVGSMGSGYNTAAGIASGASSGTSLTNTTTTTPGGFNTTSTSGLNAFDAAKNPDEGVGAGSEAGNPALEAARTSAMARGKVAMGLEEAAEAQAALDASLSSAQRGITGQMNGPTASANMQSGPSKGYDYSDFTGGLGQFGINDQPGVGLTARQKAVKEGFVGIGPNLERVMTPKGKIAVAVSALKAPLSIAGAMVGTAVAPGVGTMLGGKLGDFLDERIGVNSAAFTSPNVGRKALNSLSMFAPSSLSKATELATSAYDIADFTNALDLSPQSQVASSAPSTATARSSLSKSAPSTTAFGDIFSGNDFVPDTSTGKKSTTLGAREALAQAFESTAAPVTATEATPVSTATRLAATPTKDSMARKVLSNQFRMFAPGRHV